VIWRFLEGLVEGVLSVFLGAVFLVPLLFCAGLAIAGWITEDTRILLAALGCTFVTVVVGGTLASWLRFR
jgi:NhaP-type Na+/H+ or K+/H+ antiporter